MKGGDELLLAARVREIESVAEKLLSDGNGEASVGLSLFFKGAELAVKSGCTKEQFMSIAGNMWDWLHKSWSEFRDDLN